MSCHWSCDPRGVKISGHSEQLGPRGSTLLASCQHVGRFYVRVCSLFVYNWWAKFKQNIIVLCICRHDMVAIMMSNPGLSNKFDVDPLSNSDSKRSNTLFRAGGWSLSPVSAWRVFLVPFLNTSTSPAIVNGSHTIRRGCSASCTRMPDHVITTEAMMWKWPEINFYDGK